MIQKLSLVLLGASLACAGAPSNTHSLAVGEWRLASLGQAAAQPADVSRRPWLRFSVDSGRVSGNLGCNRASGSFSSMGDSLQFGPLVSTKMACADDALNRQEAALAGAVQSVNRYRIRGDTLELLTGDRIVATLLRSH